MNEEEVRALRILEDEMIDERLSITIDPDLDLVRLNLLTILLEADIHFREDMYSIICWTIF
jgi:hypothetical protein